MADFKKYIDKLMALEGGYAKLKNDKGGATKYGVTLQTWKEYGYDKNGDGVIDEKDVQLITLEDANKIAKEIFWDYFKADQIHNQSVAEFIVDWGYNSGRTTIAKKVQTILGLTADGIVGTATISKINSINQQKFFDTLKAARTEFINRIVQRDPSQQRFYQGWMNRIQSFFFREGDKQNL